jgi:anti-sigma factor ChrR (cupin superfamily)
MEKQMFAIHNLTRAALCGVLFLSAPVAADADVGPVNMFGEIAWQQTGLDGAEMAILWGSEETGHAVWAFRIQPGVEIPPHTHGHDYRGIAVQGEWVHIDADGNAVATEQNAFALIRAGDLHSDRCKGPEVCINILDFDGPRDIIFPE